MKKAGAVLGEGKYGFVIDPPIPCADGRDMQGYVTRIPKDVYDHDEHGRKILLPYEPADKKVLAKLREIDPQQKYFYYPLECVPGKLTIQNRLDGATEQNKVRSELLRKATKETWKSRPTRPRTWKEWWEGSDKQVEDETLPPTVRTAEQVEHLQSAVKLLHKHNIIHGDLHDGNVLIADDGLPRLIDFEMAKFADPREKFPFDDDDHRVGMMVLRTTLPKGGKRKTRRRQKKKTRRLKLKH